MNFHEFRNHYEDLVSDSWYIHFISSNKFGIQIRWTWIRKKRSFLLLISYKMSIEFESLRTRGGEMMARSAGNRGTNRPKNRFVNVLPFDHTRVILSSVEGVDFSDYINANHISVIRFAFLQQLSVPKLFPYPHLQYALFIHGKTIHANLCRATTPMENSVVESTLLPKRYK